MRQGRAMSRKMPDVMMRKGPDKAVDTIGAWIERANRCIWWLGIVVLQVIVDFGVVVGVIGVGRDQLDDLDEDGKDGDDDLDDGFQHSNSRM